MTWDPTNWSARNDLNEVEEPVNNRKRRIVVGAVAAAIVAAGAAGAFLLFAPKAAPPAAPASPTATVPPADVIETVEDTIVITYDPAVATLTEADKTAIGALVDRLAPGEQVAVTGFAGYSADDNWAPVISADRAAVVKEYLAELGVNNVLDIAQGRSPAIDTAAADDIASAGITHNRITVISAVTVTTDSQTTPTQGATP